jgi:hypothetical protein
MTSGTLKVQIVLLPSPPETTDKHRHQHANSDQHPWGSDGLTSSTVLLGLRSPGPMIRSPQRWLKNSSNTICPSMSI